MQSLATIGNTGVGPYPWDEELRIKDMKDTDVLVVDVGGGKGQVLKAVKETFPTLTGRMVLQDVSDVIEDAKASGLPSYIEPMSASFFERQPIQGG